MDGMISISISFTCMNMRSRPRVKAEWAGKYLIQTTPGHQTVIPSTICFKDDA